MAKVIPFEAFRYNTQRFGRDVKRFVSPPYDVIDGALERKLKEDRLNIAHIILGDEKDSYAVAARRLRTWIEDGVLVKDRGESFYLYEQTFSMPDGTARVRSGVIGLVKLEEFSKGTVLPHEKTIPRHKADRMDLMEAVKGDTEQIFLLYDEPSNQIEGILTDARRKEEELRFFDSDGVQHRIVRIDDADMVRRITELLGPVNLLIADGHHRYETALEYRDMMRAREKAGGERPYDYIMATLVSFRNPGLVIYSTHRLVQGVDPALLVDLPAKLAKEFDLESCLDPEKLEEAVGGSARGAFGVWIPSSKSCLLASPKEDTPLKNPIEGLPVWTVQEKVLKVILGYTSEMLDTKVNIEYVKANSPIRDIMETGEYQACFFVKPPQIDQVLAVARTGQKMPHKSTYFFPKIWSGTLLYMFGR